MLDTGFVSLHRSILKWEWYTDLTTFKLFTHLLLTVNWRDDRWMGHTIKRGQRVCSLNTLAAETGLTEKQIRTATNHLKETGGVASEIIRINRSGCTLYTVINFDKYQVNEDLGASETASEGQVKGRSRAGEGRIMNNTIIHNKAIHNIITAQSCNPAPSQNATSSAAPLFEISVLKGETFSVYREDVEKWQSLYPSVNIEQQIRNMIGWLEGNPTRRKTLKGMPRFIHNWLSREQNKGGQACVRNNAHEGLDFSFLSEMEDGE